MLFVSCKKDPPPDPPGGTTPFELTIQNQFAQTDARFAVFLSDADGRMQVFRWLPEKDTAHVVVPDSKTTDRFDCTIAKITTLISPGTGIYDTTVVLTTYTNLAHGTPVLLDSPGFLEATDLYVTLQNFNTLDSIVVPDGLTFDLPQAGNNYKGHYRILHTGRFWCRLRINGETAWRYVNFDQIHADSLNATLDLATLPEISTAPASVSLPFPAAWNVQADRIADISQRQFLSIGEPIRVPGGAIPIFDAINLYEPPNLPFNAGYRLRLNGTELAANGYTYLCDRVFSSLPAQVPALPIDIQPTLLADNKLAAAICSGPIDLLAFTRDYTDAMLHLQWELLVSAGNNGLVSTRLPDLPAELAALFKPLKNYAFGGKVRIRAESYDAYSTYEQVIARRLVPDDPLWQMKAGYLGRERVF